MKFINRNQKAIIQLIAWLQIIGGITGLFLMAKLLLQTGQITGPILLIFILGISLFIFSIFAGCDLLKSSEKENHFTLTIINQILQIVHGRMFGWGLEYTSGANLSFGVEATELKFNISLIMSTFQMSVNSDNAFALHINLCAIFIILVLVHFKEGREEAKEIENNYVEEKVSDVDLLS
ncbi:hypothetical protein [Olivibacter jilunii]|uniref:hypothetical protein n=1 Tax=Olivibacter jilunii TaxID=985016 RepID=UPI003F170F2A